MFFSLTENPKRYKLSSSFLVMKKTINLKGLVMKKNDILKFRGAVTIVPCMESFVVAENFTYENKQMKLFLFDEIFKEFFLGKVEEPRAKEVWGYGDLRGDMSELTITNPGREKKISEATLFGLSCLLARGYKKNPLLLGGEENIFQIPDLNNTFRSIRARYDLETGWILEISAIPDKAKKGDRVFFQLPDNFLDKE